MKTKSHKHLLIAFIVLVILALGFFVLPQVVAKTYVADSIATLEKEEEDNNGGLFGKKEEEIVPETPAYIADHIETPEPLYGVYMTSWVAGTPSLRNAVVKLVDETPINAIVLDIKDYSGKISFAMSDPLVNKYESTEKRIGDIKGLIEEWHAKGIYVIGRITVFQDPYLSKTHPEMAIKSVSTGDVWKDKNGLGYLYPGSENAWEYTLAIANEAYAIGFDEINFDYIRFPSDGNIKDMAIPASGKSKADIVESFFAYVHEHTKDTGLKTSADLFGMVTTNTDDLGIGQVLERALPYFDYICPMVYPSHYPANFNGWANPNANPHDLIKYVMEAAVRRADAMHNDPAQTDEVRDHVNKNQLRPWLQNFSLGQPPYTATEIHAQIQGTYDAGLSSWILWDASNKYNYTRAALTN